MEDRDVYILTKSFGRYSAGTRFYIRGQSGGTTSHCERVHGEHEKADIPTQYLVKQRNRGKAEE